MLGRCLQPFELARDPAGQQRPNDHRTPSSDDEQSLVLVELCYRVSCSAGFDINQFASGGALDDRVNDAFCQLLESGPKPSVAAIEVRVSLKLMPSEPNTNHNADANRKTQLQQSPACPPAPLL